MLFAHSGAPLFPQRSMISPRRGTRRGERERESVVIDTFTIAGRFSSLPFTESTAWLVSIAGRPRCCLVGSIYMQIPTIKRRNEGVDGAFVHTRKWVIRTIVGTRYRETNLRGTSLTIQSDPTQLLQLEMGQFFKTDP